MTSWSERSALRVYFMCLSKAHLQNPTQSNPSVHLSITFFKHRRKRHEGVHSELSPVPGLNIYTSRGIPDLHSYHNSCHRQLYVLVTTSACISNHVPGPFITRRHFKPRKSRGDPYTSISSASSSTFEIREAFRFGLELS